MLSFSAIAYIFYGSNFISVSLIILLAIMYYVERQNALVISGCIVYAAAAMVLMLNLFIGPYHLESSLYCIGQTLFFIYALLSMYIHLTFLMLHNCIGALGWKPFGIHKVKAWVPLLIMLALVLPAIAIVVVGALYHSELSDIIDEKDLSLYANDFCDIGPTELIDRRAFFCYSPTFMHWRGFRSIVIFFGLVGSLLAFYLLYQTLLHRHNVKALHSSSQISNLQILRPVIATVFYIVLMIGSVLFQGDGVEHQYPGLLEDYILKNPQIFMRSCVPSEYNPFISKNMCGEQCPKNRAFFGKDSMAFDPVMAFHCASLCPSIDSFRAPILGAIVFFMYGLGSVAQRFYARMWARWQAKLDRPSKGGLTGSNPHYRQRKTSTESSINPMEADGEDRALSHANRRQSARSVHTYSSIDDSGVRRGSTFREMEISIDHSGLEQNGGQSDSVKGLVTIAESDLADEDTMAAFMIDVPMTSKSKTGIEKRRVGAAPIENELYKVPEE